MAFRTAKANLLARGTLTQTAGTSDAVLGLSALKDGVPSWPWKAGALAASFKFKLDGDLLAGIGQFEALTGWTEAGSGTGIGGVTLDATTPYAGSNQAKLTPGAGGVARRKGTAFTIYSGETINVWAALKGSGSAAGPASIIAYIPELNKYYDPGTGTWVSGLTVCLTRTANTYAVSTVSFTVPPFYETFQDTMTLEISVYNAGTAVSYVDALIAFPNVDAATFHGHNLLPRQVVTVSSSDDGSAWTSRMTPTIAHPAFYSRITPVAARYWQVEVTEPLSLLLPRLGEVGLWLTSSPAAVVRHPSLASMDEPEVWPQERQVSRAGATFVTEIADRQVRERQLTFRAYSLTALDEVLGELTRRTRGGADPVILIPTDSEPLVLFGRCRNVTAPVRDQNAIWSVQVAVAEEPGPTFGA